MDFRPVARQDEAPSYADVGFVFIAMGPVAFGQVIDYAITSLRDVGGYQGRVFVMTDQERCFAHLRERDARKGAETITIHVEPPQDSLRDSINNVNLRRTRFRMLKTQLLEYLPHDVRFAVFLDSDVLTTKEDCVDGFLAQNAADPWPDTMAIRLRWRSGHGPHAGSFVLKRGASELLLAQWREEFLVEDSLDRLSFIRAATKLYDLPAVNTSDLAEVERRSRFVGPIVGGDRFIDGDMNVRDFCFTHISNARCTSLGKARIDEILTDVIPGYADDLCPDRTSAFQQLRVDLERIGVAVGASCESKLRRLSAEEAPVSFFWWIAIAAGIILLACSTRERRKGCAVKLRRSSKVRDSKT